MSQSDSLLRHHAPHAHDIRMVGAASPMRGIASPRSGPASRARSPPRVTPPPALPARPPASASCSSSLEPSRRDVEESDDDADVEEEVESDDLVDGQDYCEVCVEEGDSARASRYAFVEIDPPAAATAPAPLIHAAFNFAAPGLCFQILPSAHGVALLHFGSPEAREAAMSAQPFHVGGATVSLGRIEETTDRFVHEPTWLVEVAVWNFPEEHWDEERIHKLFACIGEVMEIDPFCFPGFDRSCLRFVIALQHPRVLHCVGIHPQWPRHRAPANRAHLLAARAAV